MYSITTLSGGEQVVVVEALGLVQAISFAVENANKFIATSEHSRKEHHVTVSQVIVSDTLAPKRAIAEIRANFPTVKKSGKTFWVIEN
jgi:hypothetical protein